MAVEGHSARCRAEEVIRTDGVVTKLAGQNPTAVEALELRFLAGLTNEEAALAMGLSVASFRRMLKRVTALYHR